MRSHPREKIGRNDSCPCGSGRKYKHCCLRSQEAIDSQWARQHEESGRLTQAMMSFAAREFGELVYEAWKDFNMSDFPKPLEDAGDEVEIFMPYFLYQWDPERSPRSKKAFRGGMVVRWFVEDESERLSEMERLFIEQSITQPLSFYEVLRSDPGRGLAVKDVLTGEEAEVIERMASQTARAGDLLYAQLWHEPDLTVLGCCAPLCITPQKKVEVIELRKYLRKKIAKQNRDLTKDDLLRFADTIRETYLDIRDMLHAPPRFANTDGDPLHFHTLTFRVGSVACAFQALAPLAVGFSPEDLLEQAELDESGEILSVEFDWLKRGNRKMKAWENTILGSIKISKGRLVAEVNSAERAQRLRQEIEERLGLAGTHESTVSHTLDGLREMPGPPKTAEALAREAKFDALLRDPEVRARMQATMQKDVESWIHQKIPALGGRTPIEAVRDPDGKEAVEALILQWERNDEKEVLPNQIRGDVSALRRLLNLAPRAS
jgi:hypothetical protein